MKSATDILKESLIGKTLVKRAYDDDLINREIVDVEILMDETREDAVVTLYFAPTSEYENHEVEVYSNEGLELK